MRRLAIDMTRDEVAHKMHQEAHDAVRRLEQQANSVFNQMYKAQIAMKEIGVSADILIPEYLASGYLDYKIAQEKINGTL